MSSRVKRFARSLIPLSIVFLSSCASNQSVPNYLQAIQQHSFNPIYRHHAHGRVSIDQAPMKQDYEECSEQLNQQILKGDVFSLGGIKLSELAVIEQIYRDYHAYLMESVLLLGAQDEDLLKKLIDRIYKDSPFKTLRRDAFESSSEIFEQLKVITRAVRSRDNCLERKGWRYVKKKEKSR